tara:strand:+ start:1840 stop:2949 length:1110 start_codon:yes stop_codon:yes gene_type:complete
MFSKINIYLVKHFLLSFVMVFLVFAALLIIGDFVEQFRKSTGKEVPLKIIFQLAVLNFFSLIEFIVPIVTFFAALLTYILLIRNSEFLIIGSVGISNLRVLIPAVTIYFIIGIFFVTIINPLSAVFYDRYTELEYKYIAKSDKFASITKNGIWLKQFNSKKNISSVLYAQQISDNGSTLLNFMLLEYDDKGAFQGRLDGKKAFLESGYWTMNDVQISPKYSQASFNDKLVYMTNIKPSDITNSLSSPDSISIWKMGKFINFLEDLGYSSREFKLYYYNLIILPFFLSFLTILASSLVSDLKQNSKISKTVFAAFLLIFVIYFLSNLLDALGSSSQVSPFIAKITTPIFVLISSFIFFNYSYLKRNKIVK